MTLGRHAAQRAKVAILAGLALAAAAQLFTDLISTRTAYVRDPAYADKLARMRCRFEQAAKATPEPPLKVVMLGSSRTSMGFNAKLFEQRLSEELGRPAVAYNFGFPATGPMIEYLYLRRLLADGIKPDLLLIELLPSVLCELNVGPIEQWWLNGDRLWKDEIELVSARGCDGHRLRTCWRQSWVTPLYTHRLPLVARAMPSLVKWNMRQDFGRQTDEAGWGPPPMDSVSREEYVRARDYARGEYGCLAWFKLGGPEVEFFEDLLELCRSHGLTAALVLMPEGTDFQGFYPQSTLNQIFGYLGRITPHYGLPVINARSWVTDDGFFDSHHMLPHGACQFSDRLGREVGTRFPALACRPGARSSGP